jgi:hypothetical protein
MTARVSLRALLAALFLMVVVADAHAQLAPRRVAFAVVVGNNRSLSGRQPDLHYADDDAAKYFAILQTVAPNRVKLLTTFDDDTGRLFPAPARPKGS